METAYFTIENGPILTSTKPLRDHLSYLRRNQMITGYCLGEAEHDGLERRIAVTFNSLNEAALAKVGY